jgi:hypothetical protein
VNRPELRHEGDDIVFTWGEGIEATVRDIHDSRDGPRAEVRLGSKLQGHLHYAMLNLLSTNSRETYRRALQQRDDSVDWQAVLEQIGVLAVESWRSGDPFVRVDPRFREREQAYLLRPVFPDRGVSLLYGDGAAGKSMLAQHAALAVARGEGFAGLWAAGPMQVGYLDWETDEEEFADRMAWLGSNGSDVWYRRCWAPLPQIAREIKREADQLSLTAIFYDSLGFACGGEVKEADVVLRAFSAIRYIGRPGALVHHVPKESKEPYGSVYVRNASRNVWYLAKAAEEEGGFTAALIHKKSNMTRLLPTIGLRYRFGEQTAAIESMDPKQALAALRQGDTQEERVLEAMEGERLYPRDIAERSGISPNSIRTVLSRMRDRGMLDKTDDGRYGKGVIA